MGTSIRAVIEYQEFKSGGFTAVATAHLLRDHQVFSAIALGDGGITDGLPYPPRGVPKDLSSEARDICLNPERREYDDVKALAQDTYGHGWLNFGELLVALRSGGLGHDELRAEYRAVVAAMRALADSYGPERVRLVFCFD